MWQQEAINKISRAITSDNFVRAIFFKGSLGRGEGDQYSDVDFYCILKEDKRDEFLKKRIDYLQTYKPLIYWSESNFVGPQIIGVFNNGLHFDLYSIMLNELQYTDGIKVIYDPEQLL
ncbi:MAG: nucleotidyltransferase domain-containing protein, partial [Candidatus Edwardsbacteria bacterium]|nr:nucleotidyltransferase domain-containing protein [Candidatus Edwardsbacteria bacterium]